MFSAILANIQGIYIRTLYDGVAVQVENVRLEGAKKITNPETETSISGVELCTCDPARNTEGMKVKADTVDFY